MGNYLEYNKFDMANGPGVRQSLFLAGCHFRCQGCWNPESWNPRAGKQVDQALIDKILEDGEHSAIQGLSILGGEPLDQIDTTLNIAKQYRSKFPERNIWLWTGHTIDEVYDSPELRPILDLVDTVVDGRFILAQRNLKLQFRGSSNQRIIDVREFLESKNS